MPARRPSLIDTARRSLGGAAAICLAGVTLAAAPAFADTPPDTLIVFDASGSMWGQIHGRTKIEIARETLSTVLSEVPAEMNLGMIAYGHRVRGQCSDIETLVPMGPAGRTVPQIIGAANAITPRGMTPLSDAVRLAAEEMLFTERAATVVLVTDGIETCDADPCALGAELAAAGIDFTAHVVGFGLTGEEGRQVACLAELTGGRYFPADDAEQLTDALRQTIAADDRDFVDEPVAAQGRRIELTLRDTEDGPMLKSNEVTVLIEPLSGGTYDDWRMWHHERSYTAEGVFEPGLYSFLIARRTDGSDIRYRFDIEVTPGTETLVLDHAIAARLRVDTLVNRWLRVEHGRGVPTANRSGNGYGVYELVPIEGGVPNEAATLRFGYRADLDIMLAPGDYLLRGTFARSFTREKLITIPPGQSAEIDFDFELARVLVDFRDATGFPPSRPYTRLSDEPGGTSFFVSGRDHMNGEHLPWYLPVGAWRLDTGQESAGDRRAQTVVTVQGAGEEIVIRVGEGDRLTDYQTGLMADEGRIGCLGFGGTEHGRNACILERVDFAAASADPVPVPIPAPATDPVPVPSAGETGAATAQTVVPQRRYDFVSTATMQPVAAIIQGDIFADPAMMKILLHEGWCGAGCAADIVDVLVPAGTDLDLGAVIFAESAMGSLKFVTGRDGGPTTRLLVHAATGDYWDGDTRTGVEYIDAIGLQLPRPILDGFPDAGFSPRPLPVREVSSNPPIAPGIYALIERADFDPADGADIGEAVMACVQSPFVAYPDGAVQVKSYSPGMAAMGAPYRTEIVGTCRRQTNGIVGCEMWQPEMPGERQVVELLLSGMVDQHLHVVSLRDQQEGTLYACVRPGGEMSATETLPDGRRVIDHIMARADGGAELLFGDDGAYLGPKLVAAVPAPAPAPAPAAAGDGGGFDAIAGLYGRLPRGAAGLQGPDLADACYFDPLVLYPDGFAQGFRSDTMYDGPADRTPVPLPIMHMTCRGAPGDATCAAWSGPYPGGMPVPEDVHLAAQPQDQIEICVAGDCFRMQRCPDPRALFAGDLPAPDGRHWLDHVLRRPDRGPGLGAGLE